VIQSPFARVVVDARRDFERTDIDEMAPVATEKLAPNTELSMGENIRALGHAINDELQWRREIEPELAAIRSAACSPRRNARRLNESRRAVR
jgi:hypothetical protein